MHNDKELSIDTVYYIGICLICWGMNIYLCTNVHMNYGQNLVHGEGTSLSWVGPYRFSVAAPCTNLPGGIVLGIILGWAPVGFAAMATPRPSQYYFGHT